MFRRIFNRRALLLYVQNAGAGAVTFVFDLALIWLLVSHAGMNRFAAVVLGFIAANMVHYLIARSWIFRGSVRGLLAGYAYFLANALIGLAVILAGFAVLTEWLDVPFIAARTLASVCAGTLVFFLNATMNFRQL